MYYINDSITSITNYTQSKAKAMRRCPLLSLLKLHKKLNCDPNLLDARASRASACGRPWCWMSCACLSWSFYRRRSRGTSISCQTGCRDSTASLHSPLRSPVRYSCCRLWKDNDSSPSTRRSDIRPRSSMRSSTSGRKSHASVGFGELPTFCENYVVKIQLKTTLTR